MIKLDELTAAAVLLFGVWLLLMGLYDYRVRSAEATYQSRSGISGRGRSEAIAKRRS